MLNIQLLFTRCYCAWSSKSISTWLSSCSFSFSLLASKCSSSSSSSSICIACCLSLGAVSFMSLESFRLASFDSVMSSVNKSAFWNMKKEQRPNWLEREKGSAGILNKEVTGARQIGHLLVCTRISSAHGAHTHK